MRNDDNGLRGTVARLMPGTPGKSAGVALPPVVQPGDSTASPLRKRIRELAREYGIVDIPRTYVLPVVADTPTFGHIDWQKSTGEGPIIIVSMVAPATTIVSPSTGAYTAKMSIGDRTIANGVFAPGNTQFSVLQSILSPANEFPAPWVLRRKDRLSMELTVTAPDVFSAAPRVIFNTIVLRGKNREPLGAVADELAERLLAEGELWILPQQISATSPSLQSEFRSTYPMSWHGGSVSGLFGSNVGTYRQILSDFDLFAQNGSAPGIGSPLLSVVLIRGDFAQGLGEAMVASFAGGTVVAPIDALWFGRIYR